VWSCLEKLFTKYYDRSQRAIVVEKYNPGRWTEQVATRSRASYLQQDDISLPVSVLRALLDTAGKAGIEVPEEITREAVDPNLTNNGDYLWIWRSQGQKP
jgi:hypothetical protein